MASIDARLLRLHRVLILRVEYVEHVAKLKNIPATIHAAPTIAHMDLPGFRLHPAGKAFGA